MIKKSALLTVCIIVICALPARAEQYLGVGFHVGSQNDAGNITSYNPELETDSQVSLLLGVSFKASCRFFFLRTGVDTTFAVTDGRVLENSDAAETITRYSITYTGVPLFAGLNFPVQDIGEFYMGGGVEYFLAGGTISMGAQQKDISAMALGYGFIAGVQLNVTSKTRLYMEWEYIDARTGAIMQTTAAAWDNLYIDLTGHRIMVGFMYYVI